MTQKPLAKNIVSCYTVIDGSCNFQNNAVSRLRYGFIVAYGTLAGVFLGLCLA